MESTRRERQYRELQTGLAHANRVTTMGPLTASITHEVKQPITAMVANAHRRRKGDLNEKPAGMNRRGLVSVSAN